MLTDRQAEELRQAIRERKRRSMFVARLVIDAARKRHEAIWGRNRESSTPKEE